MWRHVPVPAAVAVAIAIVAGSVLLAVSNELSTASVIGFVLLGAGGIGAMSLAFYAVGRSEDEERERERERRGG